jgi:glycosyltransferase involved in cell wall biosynthesis
MSDPVLLVTPRWRRDGGVATHVMASAAALAASGVDVHVLAAIIEPDEHVPGITFHHSPDLNKGDVAPARRVDAAMSCSPRIVHFHQFEDVDVASHIQRSAPLIVSVHGYSACTSAVHYFRPGEECERPHGAGCVPNLLARGCAHTRNPSWLPGSYQRATRSVELLRQADLVISYSSVIDRHLDANGILRRARAPLFSTLPPTAVAPEHRRRRVVFAGRVVRPKGVQVLLRAASTLDAELVVCGDGRDLDSLRSLAGRLGMRDRVSFKGWLTAAALAAEFAEAQVVAIPSVWPEPFGLVGIEAFALGIPVVASHTGGIGDWLEHGVSGLAVAPGDASALADALRELLGDPQRARAMGAAGRESVASRFTPRHHVSALLAAFSSARAGWEHRRASKR